MANTVLYLDPDEPYSVPAALLRRPPSPAKTTLVSRKGKTVPPGGKLVPGVRPKPARNQGKPHPGKKTAAIPADAASRPFAPGRLSPPAQDRVLAARRSPRETPYQELFSKLVEAFTPDPAKEAELEAIARAHWTGPSFRIGDWEEALSIVRRHEIRYLHGALHGEGPAVAALFEHAHALEGGLLNATPAQRGRLLARLSATSLAAWIVSQGDAGGQLPWECRPRPPLRSRTSRARWASALL